MEQHRSLGVPLGANGVWKEVQNNTKDRASQSRGGGSSAANNHTLFSMCQVTPGQSTHTHLSWHGGLWLIDARVRAHQRLQAVQLEWRYGALRSEHAVRGSTVGVGGTEAVRTRDAAQLHMGAGLGFSTGGHDCATRGPVHAAQRGTCTQSPVSC